jgi:hypothetical protein
LPFSLKDMKLFELGTLTGRGQALGAVANHALAAQARCLRDIREAGSYKQLGLSWAKFCEGHIGLSRQSVDALIQRLGEFGETYFRLSEIVQVSPETYRRLAPKIQDGHIESEGERIEITPENSARVRKAVRQLNASRKGKTFNDPVLRQYAVIQDAVATLTRICNDVPDPAVWNRVGDVVHSSIRRLEQLQERLRNRPAA